MNHSASRDCARTVSSVESAVRTTRMTPSAPIPACRSAMRCTWAGVSSREPSRSGTRTKSFSVPWPLVKRVMSGILRHAVSHLRIRLANRRERPVEQVGRGRVEPDDARIGAEPRLLAPGVAARRLSGVAPRRGLVEVTVDDGDGLAVADGPTGRDAVAQADSEQGLGLGPQTVLPHALDPSVDPLDEDVAVKPQSENDCGRDELAFGHRRTEGPARQLDDLQRPDDTTEVAGQDRGRRPRVQTAQPRVQGVAADDLGLRLEAGAHLGVGRWDLEPVEGRPHVEARPTDEQRAVTAAPDGSDVGPRGDLVARDAGLLGHVEDVELVVPDTPALTRGQLGRADVHATVEL